LKLCHKSFTTKYGSKSAAIDPAIEEYANYIAEQMKSQFKEFKRAENK
jgi:hypothetical protein